MLTCVPNASAESYFLLANARMAQHNYQMARQHYYRCVECALHVCVALLHVCVALPQHIHHFPACGLLRLTCGPSQGDSSGPGARELDGEMSVPSVRDVLIGSCSLTTDQTSLLNRVASRRSPHPSLALTRRLISTLSHAATPPTHQPFSWRVGCRSILGWCSATTTTTRRCAPPPSDLVQGAEPPIYQDEINARRAANSADPVENNLPFLRPAPHRPARPRRQSRSTAARSSSRRT